MLRFKWYFLIFITQAAILVSCADEQQTDSNLNTTSTQNSEAKPAPQPEKDVQLTSFKTTNGWGFDITINGSLYIHQEHIPAVNGMVYFKTEDDAIKVAEMMAEKIYNNIMPPSITPEELQAAGIDLR
jgi:hypothetical protein